MIPNHESFIEAIRGRRKVCVRYYSKPDHGVLDRVCAPMDYGPGGEVQDGLNRYWLWDYAGNTGSQALSLVSQQIVDVQVLGELFNPSDFGTRTSPWCISREWGSQPQPVDPTVCAPPALTLAAKSEGGATKPVAQSKQPNE